MRVYFDNAATTPLIPEVLTAMLPYLKGLYGNPSSIHSFGREARVAIDRARSSIAELVGASPGEIIFTSGGTEANNMALQSGVRSLGIKDVISSKIEHHAVLHTLGSLENLGVVKVQWVNLKQDGALDIRHLETLLSKTPHAMVSLMAANNEIGNLLPVVEVSAMCTAYNAVFHSDMVQAIGHYNMSFQKMGIALASCSAHKFHGPKSTGFLYIDGHYQINPFIYGGPQERNMRGGTENVCGIVGMAKALEFAVENMEKDGVYIRELKRYMIAELKRQIKGIQFNGESGNSESLYTVLNVLLPKTNKREMLLFNLDIAGIAVSGGSACSSGVNEDSHVLAAIGVDTERPSVRFSFSRENTKEEIDYCVKTLVEVLH